MTRRRPRSKYHALLSEIDAMHIGDCLCWQSDAKPRNVGAALSNHYAGAIIIRVVHHAGKFFIVRVG